MSNEDKIREDFEEYCLSVAPVNITRDEDGYHDVGIEARWYTWKACAAIKDAEIAKLHTLVNAQAVCLQEHHAEIASRDLMIKKFIDRARETKSLLAASMHEPREQAEYEKEINDINDLIANSERHNSRALEKMLLEAELKGLATPDFELAYTARELQAKLAELNKE